MDKKECVLVNGRFCWILKVDGQSIPFNQAASADYFEEHYRGLGYNVRREDEYSLPEEGKGFQHSFK
jgi:hypothetical protein